MLEILVIEILLLRNINMIREIFFFGRWNKLNSQNVNKYVMILLNIVWLIIFVDFKQ